ncbi:MAG TPA: cytochrome c oxidase subunit II [Thermoanaerobaculia bacterium]|nr:cytochrome c oxidase subunit II [Thermoanaerobaculia bacterium]
MRAFTVPGLLAAAERVSSLGWLMLACLIGIFVLVIGFLALALIKSHRRQRPGAAAPAAAHEPGIGPGTDRRLTRGVVTAVAATVVMLLVLLFAGVRMQRPAPPPAAGEDALEVEVTGHQWWWEIVYPAAGPQPAAVTANELHIPVGRPVKIRGTSRDVVHGFSVPSLGGSMDLIPGRYSDLWIQAGEPGVYRGQCAEFCGEQHAHMAFLVVAEPPEEFEAWLAAQRRPAADPDTPQERRGRQVFLSSSCPTCHTLAGTTRETSRIGPDLTHLAGRRTLGGATLPNDRGNLAGWIVDPQRIKPGNRMPPNLLKPEDLQALLDYLESLE